MNTIDGTFDIDEVLARYLDVFLVWHNKEYGTHLRLPDIHSYHIRNIVGCTYEEERHRIDKFERCGAIERIQPEKGMEHIIALTYSFDIALVTSRAHRLNRHTRRWVCDNFGDAFIGIFFTDTDGFGPAQHTKAQICKKLGARFHVDDMYDHAVAVATEGIAAILYGDVPYNKQQLPDGLDIVRKYDLKSTAEYIRKRFTPSTARPSSF